MARDMDSLNSKQIKYHVMPRPRISAELSGTQLFA
jgi:hypothetical protein